jgi:hypothetical protein
VFTLAVLGATSAAAQVPVVLAPPNIVLPNFNGQQPGLTGSLEAGALVARGDDASATWYNPAGLTRVDFTTLTASGGAMQWLWVSQIAFPTHAYSSNHVPAQIGLAWKEPFNYLNWVASVSFSAANRWEDDLSSELQVGTAQAPERFSYAASSSYSWYTASVGAGYTPDKKLRLGGSVDIEFTQMKQAQSVNDRNLVAPRATSLLVASYSNVYFTHLRASFGVQYDVSEKIQVGGVFKTPGIQMANRGSAGFDATLNKSGTMTNLSYYDGSPDLKFKVPFEFAAGVAYNATRFTFEGDIRITQGSVQYAFFTPRRTVTGIVDTGNGAPQGIETDFRSYSIDSRSVFDFRVGGHYTLSSRGKLKAHGGFATNNSPVGEDDEVFQKVNLWHLTLGLSGETEHFVFAGGLDYQAGTSPLYDVYTAQNEQVIKTTVAVDGFALLYSFGVRF